MKNIVAHIYSNAKLRILMRLTLFSVLVGAITPKTAVGQIEWFDLEPVSAYEGREAVAELFDRLINFAVGLLVIVAVVLILYSAYLHLLGGGEPEKIKEARRWILYTAYAIAIALLSKGIVFIFAEIAGGEDVADEAGANL